MQGCSPEVECDRKYCAPIVSDQVSENKIKFRNTLPEVPSPLRNWQVHNLKTQGHIFCQCKLIQLQRRCEKRICSHGKRLFFMPQNNLDVQMLYLPILPWNLYII